jgi:hypothetical protein
MTMKNDTKRIASAIAAMLLFIIGLTATGCGFYYYDRDYYGSRPGHDHHHYDRNYDHDRDRNSRR